MRNLVLIFLRFGHIFLFLFLEAICFYFIINFNEKQGEIWSNSSNIAMGYTSEKWNDWTNYWNLREKMDLMAIENAKLKEKLINYELRPSIEVDSIVLDNQVYELIPAKVINTSIDRPNNHILLDKGKRDGIEVGMGVISDRGIVGIIRNVNEVYAQASSVLHRRSFISAAIKRTGAFGDLRWVGTNPRYANLLAIGTHQTVNIGDTIITTGFSAHFPPEVIIGTVQEVMKPEGENFYEIKVGLSNDFSSLRYVHIIKNLRKSQQDELKKERNNG